MLTQASRESVVRVKLPFLALNCRTMNGSVPVECADADGHALAFTSLVAAGSYLQKLQATDLELSLIFRQSAKKFLDHLEAVALVGIGFDAQPDGTKAKTVSMADLRGMFG